MTREAVVIDYEVEFGLSKKTSKQERELWLKQVKGTEK